MRLNEMSFYSRPFTALMIALAGLVSQPAFAQQATVPPVEFERQVLPIIEQHCIKCHGPDKQKGGLRLDTSAALTGGDSGKVILPGQSGKSLLIQLVTGSVPDDADAVMPPKGPRLSADEVKLLSLWIDDGAVWPSGTKNSSSSHWSLQVLKKPAVPEPAFAAWGRGPIDQFIGAKLKATGLRPTPEASKRVLIRRLTFDLTGLPPSPKEIEAFLSDGRPDAYERLVDRLLESPHYGERWARHWLDVVRFGESHGFEYNQPRDHSWHYRNWVIDALNSDMPYDQFVRMQLAGDLLAKDDASMIAATGFLVAGPHNTTLPSSQKMRMTMQQDEYEDLVGTIGQTFLGLTINCARCHSHKFDPITQREYYSFVAAVAGVIPGERNVTPSPRGVALKTIATLNEQRETLLKQLGVIETASRQHVLAEREKGTLPKPEPPKPVARWDFDTDLKDSIGQAHGEAHRGATIENGALIVGKNGGYVRTATLPFALREKTLEAWVRLDNLTQRGGGVITVQVPGGSVFDSIVFGEREAGQWMAGSNGFARYDSFKAAVEKEADSQMVHIAIAFKADGTIIGYRNGKPYGQAYRKGLQTYEAGKSQILFGLRHEEAGGNRHLSARIDRAQLYDRALEPNEVAASAGAVTDHVPEPQLLAAMTAPQRTERNALKKEIDSIGSRLASLQETGQPYKVYAVVPQNPGQTQVLRRGEVDAPGEVVAPGGLAAVPGLSSDFGLKPNASDADRRTKLAQWITNRDNPLFARVIANRLWHYHFGSGIVETPNDFGINGGEPSHPQLLDWLATELIERDWSLKQMHRLIVTSATYRQAATDNEAAMKIDVNNRLLWRMAPRRLEAEALRDAILAVSGELNLTVGGIGYRDVREYKYLGSHFYDPVEPTGAGMNRRTVYRFAPRGAKKNMLDTFDCPDPSAMAPKRAVTTTPLQALTLMNNPLVLHLADRFARRVSGEVKEIDGQIDRTYLLAYGRPVRDEELADARSFITEHGLPAFCRVVFNSNEFLYLE
ncbi:MAG: DUF1553 domain-containing protein [Phycisphaeraceae bacterium]